MNMIYLFFERKSIFNKQGYFKVMHGNSHYCLLSS